MKPSIPKTKKASLDGGHVAWLELSSIGGQRSSNCRSASLYKGACAAARKRGYGIELLEWRPGVAGSVINESILARNVAGILVVPTDNDVQWDLDGVEWERFSAISVGSRVHYPSLHLVGSNEMGNWCLALDRIRSLGYERIGAVLSERNTDLAFGLALDLPCYILNRERHAGVSLLEGNRGKALSSWLREVEPDAVLSNVSEIGRLLRGVGWRELGDLGLASLNVRESDVDAGIEVCWEEIGHASVEELDLMKMGGEVGIPEVTRRTILRGLWVEGSMLPPRSKVMEI